jgi:hypothetical protein
MMATTVNGKYIIDDWKYDDDFTTFAMVRNIGWCKFSPRLSAVLIPNVGWMTY